MKLLYNILPVLSIVMFFTSCEDDMAIDEAGDDFIEGKYDPQTYTLEVPDYFETPFIPEDNPLTVDGVELGRHLFYDPILSSDSTMSCSSCHMPQFGFADGQSTSTGVLGVDGRRSSMPIMNLAFNTRGFFWDGREIGRASCRERV